MKIFYLSIAQIAVIISLLTGCAKQKTSLDDPLHKLPTVRPHEATFSQEQDNVLVCAKLLSSHESLIFFECDTLKHGYQPIMLSIYNNTHDFLLFQPSHMKLPLVSASAVAKRCHWNTSLITGSASAVAAIFFWPALIPTAYLGYSMYSSNKSITQHLQTSTIDSWDSIEIAPLSVIDRLLFVETRHVPKTFCLVLFNKDKKQPVTFLI